MTFKKATATMLSGARRVLAFLAVIQFSLFGPLAESAKADDHPTRTPIKHVIIIVGENRTFDHLFATYKPKAGETVNNLLSEGIITESGAPGPNYALAHQYSANVTGHPVFELSPTTGKALYPVLPAPLNGGPTNVCTDNGMCNLGDASSSEDGLSRHPIDYDEFLLTGGTGLTGKVPDTRIHGVHGSAPYSSLLPGPFQLTNSASFPDDSYANSPVHRFYQMWQQFDCNAGYATKRNPSGCKADFFTWTEVTVGSNVNGKTQPANFSTDYAPGKVTTGEGATAMGFYNVLQGDAPYSKELADNYAMSDNYHQPVMGGTGANSIMLGFGDAIWFSDQNGHPEVPPHNQMTFAGGPVDEIENPNPVPGTNNDENGRPEGSPNNQMTFAGGPVGESENSNSATGPNNWWIQDGYGGFGNNGASTGVYGGGSYSNCSDTSQPGVGPIVAYLNSLTPPIKPNCDPGHYYLLNNYNPGYFGDGSDAYTDNNPNNTPFTIPGTTQRSIADVLLEKNVSWKSYNDQWDAYLTDKYQLNYGTVGPNSDQYCNICNPFQYQKQIMTNEEVRAAHITDTDELYNDIENGKLPAVSYVKPSGWVDGHPASSKWNLYEGFVKKIVDAVKQKPDLWNSTAIFVTTDEGGGYYDSGYVQPLDFFGDGTRIPLIVVSPYTKPGHISHAYADHVSILKFIERNWYLNPITKRSRDNLHNPTAVPDNPYVPTNSPAISDLFDLFRFAD